MCLCSKQSSLFSFYALPSGGKLKCADSLKFLIKKEEEQSLNKNIKNYLFFIFKFLNPLRIKNL